MIIRNNFSLKPYVVTPQLEGHNICFYAEITKIIPNYHQILPLNYSSVITFFQFSIRQYVLGTSCALQGVRVHLHVFLSYCKGEQLQ